MDRLSAVTDDCDCTDSDQFFTDTRLDVFALADEVYSYVLAANTRNNARYVVNPLASREWFAAHCDKRIRCLDARVAICHEWLRGQTTMTRDRQAAARRVQGWMLSWASDYLDAPGLYEHHHEKDTGVPFTNPEKVVYAT